MSEEKVVEKAVGEQMATRPEHYIYARGPHTLEISMALSALIQAGKGKGRKGSGHALRRIGHASLRMKGVARQRVLLDKVRPPREAETPRWLLSFCRICPKKNPYTP